jgi:excisionase family DNA binding protein
MAEDKAFLSVPEVARLMGLSVARCYQLVGERRLPHIRRGRRILVPRDAWQRWVTEQADRALASTADTPAL